MSSFRVMGFQWDVHFADPLANCQRVVTGLAEAAASGAALAIFPECVISGYGFGSREQALAASQTVSGPATDAVAIACRQWGLHCVFGLLEREGETLFNTAVLVGPHGIVARYRKTHLPCLGVDRFVTAGQEPYTVHAVGPVRIGILICYDAGFPEPVRSLALAGADLIVLPTNWPPGGRVNPQYLVPARAIENAVYFAGINRVGSEAGVPYIGQSLIVDPRGKLLAGPADDRPGTLLADIDPELARQKRIVHIPNVHQIDRFADRRPELYGRIVEPNARPPGAGS